MSGLRSRLSESSVWIYSLGRLGRGDSGGGGGQAAEGARAGGLLLLISIACLSECVCVCAIGGVNGFLLPFACAL